MTPLPPGWAGRRPLLRAPLLWRRTLRDAARLDAVRRERLAALVAVAARHVPAYRERLAGLEDPRALLTDPARFARIGVLDKQALRLGDAQFVDERRDPRGLVTHRTSGSTGVPVTIRRDWQEERLLGLLRLRHLALWGVRAGDRRALLRPGRFNWHASRGLDLASRFGPWRQRVFSCFEPTPVLAAQLAAYHPHHLGGYPEVLAALADLRRAPGDPRWRDGLAPRVISCGGDTLTPLARARIVAGFPEARVGETYGSVECNLIAWECLETGLLHVCDDGVYVELLDDAGDPVPDGGTGRVVVTPLHSEAMPLLRLDLGDLAERGPTPCPCGLAVSTLRRVTGRRLAPFTLGDGTTLHPFEVLNIVVGWPDRGWMRRYRLVQVAPGRLELRVLPDGVVTDAQCDALATALQAAVAGRASVAVVVVDDLPADANGKFTYAVPWTAPA